MKTMKCKRIGNEEEKKAMKKRRGHKEEKELLGEKK